MDQGPIALAAIGKETREAESVLATEAREVNGTGGEKNYEEPSMSHQTDHHQLLWRRPSP